MAISRVAVYARVSTEDKGQNPETQLLPLREHAASRGWEVIEYVDHASARDLRGRRRWRQLLADARDRRVDLVLVWKLDRFARSALDALQWLEQLDRYGVGFKILTQDIDTTTSSGRLVFTVLAAVAEMEREIIRERVKAGMDRARSENRQLGRPKRQPVESHRRYPEIRALVLDGTLTRAEGARRLHVRYVDFAAAVRRDPKRGSGFRPP